MKRFGHLIVSAVLGLMPLGAAQGPGAPARLTFDVASIRPTKPGTINGMIKALPGGHGYTAQNVPVKLMIALMYKVPMRQIKGCPEWVENDRYDVEARVDGSYNIDDLHVMFQNLLADRFGLKFHIDSHEGNIYALTVDPGGLKMKPNDTPQDFEIPINFGPGGTVIGKRVNLEYLRWFLGQAMQRDERPVVDMTGLKGYYDFTFSFAPVLPPDAGKEALPPELANLPSIFDAVRDQLGLKLTAQKGPVEFYMVDHVERPTEN